MGLGWFFGKKGLKSAFLYRKRLQCKRFLLNSQNNWKTMKTEQVKLSQVKTNKLNPRTITGDKFNKLINSILVLPKMLELRPIVVDGKMAALGGNMRNNALKEIAKMTPEQIAQRLSSLADFQKKTAGERQVLIEWWGKWLESPVAYIIKASELSEDEQKQFMIKDNVQFGSWDYDMLANRFDEKALGDWGMDVWNANPTAFAPIEDAGASSPTPSMPDASEEDATFGGLPPELQGIDLSPADLPKFQGDDETAMERIIIVYPKEQLSVLLDLLGMAQFDKIVYRLDEIMPELKEV